MNLLELEPSVEVAHLRRLLDIQPSCLMRLGADGTVLAANDAALALLGMRSGAEALGRDFTAWLSSDERDRFRAFTAGVVQGQPASIECDLSAPSGDRQPTQFRGVPLTGHPDGEVSIAVAARNVAAKRQLEDALLELEAQLMGRDGALAAARARLSESETSRRAAEAKCAEALGDLRQLEMALAEFGVGQMRLTAERAAEEQRLRKVPEATVSRRNQEPSADRNPQEPDQLAAGLRVPDALQSRLDGALTACQERERALQQLEAKLATLAAEHAAMRADHARLVRALRDQAARLEALANGSLASAGVAGPADAPGGVEAGPGDGTR